MTIRSRLVLGLLFILVVNLGAGLYGFYRYRQAVERGAAVREQSSAIVAAALTAQVFFKKQVQEWKNILLRGGEPEQYRRYLAQFEQQERLTNEATLRLIQLLDGSDSDSADADAFVAAHLRLGRAYRAALASFLPWDSESALRVDSQVRGIDRKPTDLIDQVVRAAHAQKQARLVVIDAEVRGSETSILMLMIGVMSGTVLLLIWLVNRRIAAPIATATAIARRVSAGDYSTPIDSSGSDEYSQMLAALKTMQENLTATLDSLRHSDEQNRLLLESTSEGIYGMDTDGCCMFCNPAAAQMLGYASPDALLGEDMHATMHHSRPDGTALARRDCRACQTYRDGRGAHSDDEVFWRADGSAFPVEYHANPICERDGEGGSGRLVGAVVNFSDISARRQAETELREAHDALRQERSLLAQRVQARTADLDRANAELARSSRAKDEFLAAMSHELRTPLTSILGLSETLEDQMLGELSTPQTRAAHTIHENGVHLLALINDVLDMSRVASGRMKLHWDQVPVNQLWDASLRLIRSNAEAKDITVSTDIDPAVQLLQGDSRSLKQILVNLLGNAVKFTPQGGTVGLEVRGNAATRTVHVTVWDTGVGIPEEQQQRLFKPFVQLDNRLSRSHDGTGLGLALAFGMAQLHHGSITVQSELGSGSRFELVLPWDPQAQSAARLSSDAVAEDVDGQPLSGVGQHLVLLVDDNPDNRHMIATYLSLKGCRIITAGNGQDAVATAIEQRPDLILMDVQMPGMDGLEATRQLRDHQEMAITPIIALTALAMPGDKERCLEAGMDDYLVKPLGLKELHRFVLSWIKRTAGG